MPGKKLPPEKLTTLKAEISKQLDENEFITANQLYEIILNEPKFNKAISLGMIQNHLGNIRKQRSNGGIRHIRGGRNNSFGGESSNRNISGVKKGDGITTRRTRLSIDKRVQAVHAASKETERKGAAYEKAVENLQRMEAELRDALRRSLGSRGDALFALNSFSDAADLPSDADMELARRLD